MSNQTIHELTNLSEISTNDELPIWDSSAGATKKVNVEELSLAVNNTVNSYSTTEQKTGGVWIDGKPIYRKVVDFGALPNATTKNIAHNIQNLGFVTNCYSIAYNGSSFLILPQPSTVAVANTTSMSVTATQCTISCGIDRRDYTETYIILEYTKTTD